MNCPYCNAHSNEIRTLDTRHTEKMVRRRRMCKTCGERFSTMEVVTVDGMNVATSEVMLVPKNKA
jgi:transcriptional regulator NrdR family protein